MNYTAAGALHIHSNYSDGTGSIEEIAHAAKKAGLSWIIITDHNNLAGLKHNKEGWYDGVAVIIGEEISPSNSNHYLALNINKEIDGKLSPEDFINQVKNQGGLGFIAHPDENPHRKNSFKPLRWENWDISGFDGLEIWNYLSDWVDNYDTGKVLHCYFRRNDILTGPTPKTLKWWDDLNNSSSQIIPAIGGVDAHALLYKFCGVQVKIFPYHDSLKTVTNHLYLDKKLSEDFNQAKSQIYKALKQGKNSIINRVWNKRESEFDFYIENKESRAFSGSSIKLDNNTKLVAKIPRKARIRLICNGEPVREEVTDQIICHDLKQGKYRLEVFYKNRPWIFTNPVHCFD